MRTVADELTEKTQAYWNISIAFYAGVGTNLNTGQALRVCGDTIAMLGFNRSLSVRISHLQDRIIQGRSKRRKTDKVPNPIVQLRPLASA